MTGLIYALGIAITLFIVYTLVEFVWDRAQRGGALRGFCPG